jgi:hypothetical protein
VGSVTGAINDLSGESITSILRFRVRSTYVFVRLDAPNTVHLDKKLCLHTSVGNEMRVQESEDM